MRARTAPLPVSGPISFPADMPKPPFGVRLLRAVIAQQLKVDREILRHSSLLHDSYRQEFGLELERRILGQ